MYSCRNLPTFWKNLLPLSFPYSEHEDSSFIPKSRQFCTRLHSLTSKNTLFVIVTAVWRFHISQVNLQDGNTFRSWINLSLIYTMAATRIYFQTMKQLHEINKIFDCTCFIILLGKNHNFYA